MLSLQHILRRLDYVLVAAVAITLTFSWITVAEVTRNDIPGSPDYFASRYLVFIAGAVVVGLVVAMIDPQLYRRFAWAIYGLAVALLGIVLLLGTASSARGSSRWIPLGFFNLQPSELAKIAVAIVLAAFVADRVRPGQSISWRLLGLSLVVVAVPGLLVFVQPDLGTSIVFLAIALAILFVAGMRVMQLAAIVAVIVCAITLVFAALPAIGVNVLAPYQRDRLTAFLNPKANASTAAYQTIQSKTAIGSGGLGGLPARQATQTSSNFLPEHHTDFIFAVVGERRGFIGTAFLLALFVVIIWRAMRTITLARSLYESLIASGIAGMWLVQVFVNVGMAIGIMPITGIPLPFMSYGGSNALTGLIAVGLLLAIQLRGAVPDAPALASHDVVVNAPRGMRDRPAPLSPRA